MKIKKFLEKAAEEDREALISDKDVEYLASIGVDYNKKREADKKQPDANYYRTAPSINRRAFIISVACFLVAVFAVLTIVYFTAKPKNPGYMDDEYIEVNSDLYELNKDLQLFSLTVKEEEYDLLIKKTYGSVSGDNLFYSLRFNSKIGLQKNFTIEIVVSNKYEHDALEYTSEIKKAQISSYTLKYSESLMPMFMKVKCKGEMQIGKQCIYITNYEETALGQSTFVATLESIISFK